MLSRARLCARHSLLLSEPALSLRDEDQELLCASLRGLTTDEELACELGLKPPTVKKRWAAIFQRIAAVKPDLLPGHYEGLDRQTRGNRSAITWSNIFAGIPRSYALT